MIFAGKTIAVTASIGAAVPGSGGQPESEPPEAEPREAEPSGSEPSGSEPLNSEPLESEPLESRPLESEPLESAGPLEADLFSQAGPRTAGRAQRRPQPVAAFRSEVHGQMAERMRLRAALSRAVPRGRVRATA